VNPPWDTSFDRRFTIIEGNRKAKAIVVKALTRKRVKLFGQYSAFSGVSHWLPGCNTLQRVFIGLTLRIATAKFIFFLVGKKGLCAGRIHFFLDFFITCGNSGKQ
jgi:hypothetical protein